MQQLTTLGGYNGGVTYAPDGRRLAFHRASEAGVEIWVMDADGTNPRAITNTRIDEYNPEWSPDGTWLAVTAGRGSDGSGMFDLWLMRPDGTDRRLINNAPNTEAWHKWRPGSACR